MKGALWSPVLARGEIYTSCWRSNFTHRQITCPSLRLSPIDYVFGSGFLAHETTVVPFATPQARCSWPATVGAIILQTCGLRPVHSYHCINLLHSFQNKDVLVFSKTHLSGRATEKCTTVALSIALSLKGYGKLFDVCPIVFSFFPLFIYRIFIPWRIQPWFSFSGLSLYKNGGGAFSAAVTSGPAWSVEIMTTSCRYYITIVRGSEQLTQP